MLARLLRVRRGSKRNNLKCRRPLDSPRDHEWASQMRPRKPPVTAPRHQLAKD